MGESSKTTVLSMMSGEPVSRVPTAPPFQGFWALGVGRIPVINSIRKPLTAARAQMKVASMCRFDAMEASWDWLSPVEMLGSGVRIQERGDIITRNRLITGPESLNHIEVPDPRDDYRAISSSKAARLIVSELGDKKFLYSTLCSPFTLIGEVRGVEALLLDLILQPDFARDMLNMATDVIMEYCRFFCRVGVEGILLCDPTASGSLVSPEEFQKYTAPPIKHCMDVIREEGCQPMTHICGDTTELLDLIAEMGTTVFSFDNSVNLKKVSERVKGRMTLLGNVNPRNMQDRNLNDVMAESIECIKGAGDARFILGVGDDILMNTPVENVAAMSDASYSLATKP